jgi:hypothetical protein
MVEDEDWDEGLMWHTTGVFFSMLLSVQAIFYFCRVGFHFHTSGAMTGMHMDGDRVGH